MPISVDNEESFNVLKKFEHDETVRLKVKDILENEYYIEFKYDSNITDAYIKTSEPVLIID